ncbi:MAG: glycosyltransferase [Bacteroidaceae bacterium]|nr:glycosyltransferase [Bacteroidaceae bacterium]
MRILYIFNSLNFSGAELMYVQASETLKTRGYTLFALITAEDDGNYRQQFEAHGFDIAKIPCKPSISKRIVFYSKLKRLIKDKQIDIVHVQRSDLFFVAACAAKACHAKCVYSVNNTFTSHWYSYAWHFIKRLLARRILNCKFHCGSDTVYQHEASYYHNKGIVSYWWYDEKDYYPATAEERDAARKELSIDNNSFVITTAGSCGYQKHHEDIFEALSIIKNDIPNLLFLHLGTGALENKEREMCENLGLTSNVRFCGNQKDFRKYLIVSDLYVMTSRFEGLSNATIDALACKIPAVLYNVTGLRDYNISGENTELIDEDPLLLANSIKRLYEDHSRRQQLAESGYNLVTHKYGSKYCIDNLINTFYK